MSDHKHWWMFLFRGEPAGAYFTQLPCGASDTDLTAKLRSIVQGDPVRFPDDGTGEACGDRMPDAVAERMPPDFRERFVDRDELIAFRNSLGRPS